MPNPNSAQGHGLLSGKRMKEASCVSSFAENPAHGFRLVGRGSTSVAQSAKRSGGLARRRPQLISSWCSGDFQMRRKHEEDTRGGRLLSSSCFGHLGINPKFGLKNIRGGALRMQASRKIFRESSGTDRSNSQFWFSLCAARPVGLSTSSLPFSRASKQ